MKKVCMIAYTYYVYDPRVKREAEALAERGDEVDVICLDEAEKNQQQVINNVNIIRLKMGKYQGNKPLSYVLSYLKFFLYASLKVNYNYFSKRYHIIHIHTMPDFLVFAALIPRLFGAKVILDIHDLMPELYISKFNLKKNHYLIRLITFIERSCVNFAHQAIAVHATHLQALHEHGNKPGKLQVLLNLPDPKIFIKKRRTASENRKKTVYLYHGTISRRHGIEVAIRALQLIYKETPDILLRVIGDGDDLPRLCKLTEELNLTDYVYFNKSFITLEKIVWEIHNSDIGIIPIVRDSFTQFMLPTKLLEYVALGLPVICTRTSTVETYFNNEMVYFFTSGDIDELAQCMKDLYFNENKRQELVRNANFFNDRFNWNIQKQLLYRIIDN